MTALPLQGVDSLLQFLDRGPFADEKLEVIDHQNTGGPTRPAKARQPTAMQGLEKSSRKLLARKKHGGLFRMQLSTPATGRLEKMGLSHAARPMDHQRREFARPRHGHLDRCKGHPIAGADDELSQPTRVPPTPRCTLFGWLDGDGILRRSSHPKPLVGGLLGGPRCGHRGLGGGLPGNGQPPTKPLANDRLDLTPKCPAEPVVGHSLPGTNHDLPLAGRTTNAPHRISEPDREPLVTDPSAEGIPHAIGERRRFHYRSGDGFAHGSFLPAGRILGSLRFIRV